MVIDIDVVPFAPEIESAYKKLLVECTENIHQNKHLWRFKLNPITNSVFAVAKNRENKLIVGLNGFMGIKMKMGDKDVIGYQSMDTVVTPECTGQGVFTRLVQSFYQAAPNYDASILYGFPNHKSGPGFFNKLEWTHLASPPFLIKPLRSGYFAQRLLGKPGRFLDIPLSFTSLSETTQKLIEIDKFDSRFDDFWQKLLPSFTCTVHRTSTYLNWRISSHPAIKYQTKAIFSENGELLAYITYCWLNKHDGKVGYIMEALALPEAHDRLALLFKVMIAELNQYKVDVVLAWCASHSLNYTNYRNAGFYPLPNRLRPIKLSFGARILSQNTHVDLQGLKFEDWYLSYLDSDTV